jgi:putative transposase
MDLPKRKLIRLKDYDYSQNGAYFVTICVKDRHKMLGEIVGAIINRPNYVIQLSEYGAVVDNAINDISNHYPNVFVDKYIIMPNHIHMILLLQENDGRLIIAPTTISTIIQQLKRYVSKQIGFSIWQKSFHDHIIRNEQEYLKIWEYIDTNPIKWQDDCYYEIDECLKQKD